MIAPVVQMKKGGFREVKQFAQGYRVGRGDWESDAGSCDAEGYTSQTLSGAKGYDLNHYVRPPYGGAHPVPRTGARQTWHIE